MKHQIKYKIVTFVISLIFVAILILLFFLDTSLEWGFEKIFSCVICSIWIFFLPPTILYFAYKMKNSNFEYSIKLGFYIGAGCFIGLLITPYYGIKSYFSDLNSIYYNGEIIWWNITINFNLPLQMNTKSIAHYTSTTKIVRYLFVCKNLYGKHTLRCIS